MAFIYYRTEKEAEKVYKYVNLRYLLNRQLFVSFADNYFDITDFRTRIEQEVYIDDPRYELKLFKIQRDRLQEELKIRRELTQDDKLKMEYLNRRCRSLEFSLGFDEKKKISPSIDVSDNTTKLIDK
jgi:hypothetical protein